MARSCTQTFELEKFISTILARYKSYAEQKGKHLQLRDDLASYVLLKGNTKKIKFLLDTVLQNAIDFSDASEISFSTRQLLKSGNEILIEFLLQDNGSTPGRKPFSYYRALLRAKSMIEQLHGKSDLIVTAKGTTLKFIIKCECREGSYVNSNSFSLDELKSKQVLIVEDNEINQRAIVQILQKEGIAFQTASNGKEAIDKFEKMNRCDLVIMDLDMPYMDGFDAANYIRKKLRKDVPIIGMTSGDESIQAIKCLEAGMNQFIKKPFTAEALLLQACSFFVKGQFPLKPVLHRRTA